MYPTVFVVFTIVATICRVFVTVGVGAVTVTLCAVHCPDITVTGGGVNVVYTVRSVVTVAVIFEPVEVTVEVFHLFVFVSVTSRGCGSGARSTSARRCALSCKKRSFSSSRRKRPIDLIISATGPTVGTMTACRSNLVGRVGSSQLAVLVAVTLVMSKV